MPPFPLSIGTLHFVGIGGNGMSGVAEILHLLGYSVQGSDIGEGINVSRLRHAGVTVFNGHDSEHIGSARVVVVSNAVKNDNPEIKAARTRQIPVIHRAEMLAELMRSKQSIAVSGSHGKTTTTSMVACVLEAAGLAPTVINGGVMNACGSNAHLGLGDWIVAEADESDGSFLRLPSLVAVVTNIDAEHLGYWGTVANAREGYAQFVSNIPFYGMGVLCIDDPEVREMVPTLDRHIVTFGLDADADVRAEDIFYHKQGSTFTVSIYNKMDGCRRTLEPMSLNALGIHNVRNALAAVAIAIEMGIDEKTIQLALASVKGVQRRFTWVGEAYGVHIFDDFAHHPTEIEAVLEMAKQAGARNIIAVYQAATYSRTYSLSDRFSSCFHDAATVIVAEADAVDTLLAGGGRDLLVDGLRNHGHQNVISMFSSDCLAELVSKVSKPGDYVICMGVGSITFKAQALPQQLEALLHDSSHQ